MANTVNDLATYQKADEIMAVCRTAVRKAQEESRRQGVPNVYFLDGHLYYDTLEHPPPTANRRDVSGAACRGCR